MFHRTPATHDHRPEVGRLSRLASAAHHRPFVPSRPLLLFVFPLLFAASFLTPSIETLNAQEQLPQNPSILNLLSLRGILEIDQEVDGHLLTSDYLSELRRRVVAWDVDLTAARTYQLDLQSEAFDPYLYVLGAQHSDDDDGPIGFIDDAYALTDDDSGDYLNAQLCFTVPRDGRYRVIAAGLDAGVGPYSLHLTDRCNDSAAQPTLFDDFADELPKILIGEDHELKLGDQVESELTSTDLLLGDRHLQAWSFEQTSDVPMLLMVDSDAFDAYLLVLSPDEELIADDDTGLGTNARLTLTAGTPGTYRVFVTSYAPGGTGPYQIRVLRPRLPVPPR